MPLFSLPPAVKLVGTRSEARGMAWIPPGACVTADSISNILLIGNIVCIEMYKPGKVFNIPHSTFKNPEPRKSN